MKVFLAALLLIGLGVIGMAFNIIFRKKDEMKKRGIRCMKEEEDEIWGDKGSGKSSSCDGKYSSSCIGCNFYDKH